MVTTCPKCGTAFPGVQDAFCPECHNKLPEIALEPKEDLQPIPPTDHPPPVSPGSDGSPPPAEDPSQSDDESMETGCFLLIMVVVFAFIYFSTREGVRQAYFLSSRGVPADARVTACKPVWVSEGRTVRRYLHNVEFDGHLGEVLMAEEWPCGTVIPVLYLPETPEVYVRGKAGERFDILWMRMPVGGFAEKLAIRLVLAVLLILGIGSLIGTGFLIFRGVGCIRRFGSKLWPGTSETEKGTS